MPSLLLVSRVSMRQKRRVQHRRDPMKLSHIALSLLTLAPAPAIAQQTTPSIVVSYGDLDLGSQAGTKVLDQRLASAIRTVCGEQEGSAIRERRFAAQRCVKEKSAEVALLRDRGI